MITRIGMITRISISISISISLYDLEYDKKKMTAKTKAGKRRAASGGGGTGGGTGGCCSPVAVGRCIRSVYNFTKRQADGAGFLIWTDTEEEAP